MKSLKVPRNIFCEALLRFFLRSLKNIVLKLSVNEKKGNSDGNKSLSLK